ncbi:MAG: hypothetical protein KBS83_03735 [Lachnospiraceae bacterium]|nr:hypothetical protein [Candidatus Equihabitans merdae]
MILACITSVFADTQSEIRDTKAASDAASERLNQTNDQIATMEGEKSNLEVYLTDLKNQFTILSDSLTSISDQIDDKHADVERSKAAHERAALAVEDQYADMQLRIQYMYENGTSLLQTLCSTENFSEFLNRADEIQQIQNYDRACLEDYKETCRDEQAKQESLEAEEADLQGLKAQQEAARAQVEELTIQTEEKIAEYTANIHQQSAVADDLINQIAVQQNRLKELEAKEAEEEANRRAVQAPAEASTPNEETLDQSYGSMQSIGRCTLTAYCNCARCGGVKNAYGPTASGVYPVEGRTVAMGGVPFGTKLLINGHVYVVEDEGTPFRHVDIYFESHSEADDFGLQYAEVYIVN